MSECNNSVNFRIGIDLGTTNCALAWTSASDGEGETHIFPLPQLETPHSSASHLTLPSFLYLPPENPSPSSSSSWILGRWARTRASETPSRIVSSAKSWLVHHAADRRAKFLPLGSDDIPPTSRISPVDALALALRSLASAWDSAHPHAPLHNQEIAITVPASFDPAAQLLTREAASLAGFPDSLLLIEEPQAAFYSWMEKNGQSLLASPNKPSSVLVVDIGGGTTDLSIFSVSPSSENPSSPHLQRIAVSDHLLLGGDNLDLALAHHLEKKLSPDSPLPPTTFAQLIALCRSIKETALASDHLDTLDPSSSWPVAVTRPGASLLSGSLLSSLSASELSSIVLDGFFPSVQAKESPLRLPSGLREMGLPYAKDPAITRHLAAFLQDRPPIDFVLFNGGVTKSFQIRQRISENIARWQNGIAPTVLENTEPDLAVAAGAARYLHIRARGDSSYIDAGASHAYYLGTSGNKALCILPIGAAPDSPHLASHPTLRASLGNPVSFPLYRNARTPLARPGDVVDPSGSSFSELPALETILSLPPGSKQKKDAKARISIQTTLQSTGILSVHLHNEESGHKKSPPWPLVFALRKPSPHRPSASPSAVPPSEDAVSLAFEAMQKFLAPVRKHQPKLTANTIFSAAEKLLKTPKANWSGGIVRSLFDRWIETAPLRSLSPEHEEAWLQIAGFLLRPGCGMIGDSDRIQTLGPLLASPPLHPARPVKIQRWIAARRIAAGLDLPTSESIWLAASADWSPASPPSAEIALLLGSLEALPSPLRQTAASHLAAAIEKTPDQTAFWKALGRLLSRSLFHAGTEQVLPPSTVVSIWELLAPLPLAESSRPEAAAAWLRAARLTGSRPLDLPKPTRNQISDLLKKWGINNVRLQVLHEVMPILTSDHTALLGESPPPGLSLEIS